MLILLSRCFLLRGASEVLRELQLALESAGCVIAPPDARDPLKIRCRASGAGFFATVRVLAFSASVTHATHSLAKSYI